MLDHVTIRTTDIEGTREFFEAVLNLKTGPRPGTFDFPGYWIYSNGKDIIHLVGAANTPMDRQGEAIDHLALRCEDYDDMRTKLGAMHIPYTKSDIAELLERRLFIHTPTGIRIELVFSVSAPSNTWD
jgi:catechol 2,3-dioxygenase-like lactoylglutathione lyase family enzyme